MFVPLVLTVLIGVIIVSFVFRPRIRIDGKRIGGGFWLRGAQLRADEEILLDAPFAALRQPGGHVIVTTQRFLVLPYRIVLGGRVDLPVGAVRAVSMAEGPRELLIAGERSRFVRVDLPSSSVYLSSEVGVGMRGSYDPSELRDDLVAALARAGWSPTREPEQPK